MGVMVILIIVFVARIAEVYEVAAVLFQCEEFGSTFIGSDGGEYMLNVFIEDKGRCWFLNERQFNGLMLAIGFPCTRKVGAIGEGSLEGVTVEGNIVGCISCISVEVAYFAIEFHAVNCSTVHVPCPAYEDFIDVIFLTACGAYY